MVRSYDIGVTGTDRGKPQYARPPRQKELGKRETNRSKEAANEDDLGTTDPSHDSVTCPIGKYEPCRGVLHRRSLFAECWGEESPALSLGARQSMRFQPLLKQFNEHRSRLSLSLSRDLSNERLNCTFDQNAQDYVRVQADRTGHADRLSKNVRWVGSIGGNALNSTYEGLHGWKRTVCHGRQDGSPGGGDARRPGIVFLICSRSEHRVRHVRGDVAAEDYARHRSGHQRS
jgi:hypothetical protein